ncbi:MAG: hypothetical protein QOH06_2597 [Acidobacteriota bacterium]|jgi:hypothetical protein|nr:hypothetical protein [Acidobacteriota bacterium]
MDVKRLLRGVMAFAIAASVVVPAGATTLIRESLDEMVRSNRTIVVGEVVDVHSYWNADGTFILTDVRITAHDVLKGNVKDRELTLTIMGGRVGETTTLIIGNPNLVPGNSYVLFLNEEDLPGVKALTVRSLVQGAFDVKIGKDGLRAVSQANAHPLLPDARGSFEAEGGREGFQLNSMMQTIREIVSNTGARREVK